MKAFVPLMANCTLRYACTSAHQLLDGLRACFVVPELEVVPAILCFDDIVAVLILAKSVLFCM